MLEIALDLADALTRAHRLGIIHRDLKPANVLLAEDGTPRLTDFGIAHVSDSPRLTQAGILMGTVDYLSPEACDGEPIDERGDIWSPQAIVPAVAAALGFSFYEGGKPRLQLLDYLREKSKLLIMDNFEHLLAGPEPGRGDGAGLVTDILQTAPEVKILSTSRARLNVQGECLSHLAGMGFPEPLPAAEAETPEDAACLNSNYYYNS